MSMDNQISEKPTILVPGKLYRVTREILLHREDTSMQIANDTPTVTLEHFWSGRCFVPMNSLVVFVRGSSKTTNNLFIFKEFIGWTYLLLWRPGLFKEVPNAEEG